MQQRWNVFFWKALESKLAAIWFFLRRVPGSLGTIHILRHHIFGIFRPPSPLRQHVFCTKNKQKLAFSDLPSPLQVLT